MPTTQAEKNQKLVAAEREKDARARAVTSMQATVNAARDAFLAAEADLSAKMAAGASDAELKTATKDKLDKEADLTAYQSLLAAAQTNYGQAVTAERDAAALVVVD